jgi:hypothetical protein
VPVVIIDQVDAGPASLADAVPVRAELLRLIPGPDRPDYALAVLEHPIAVPPDEAVGGGRTVHAVVMAPRLVGQQFAPDLRDLQVALAYVIDDSLATDDTLDLAKVGYVAVATLNLDEHLPRYR